MPSHLEHSWLTWRSPRLWRSETWQPRLDSGRCELFPGTSPSAKALQHLPANQGISFPAACGIARPVETSPVTKVAADNRPERLADYLVSAEQLRSKCRWLPPRPA